METITLTTSPKEEAASFLSSLKKCVDSTDAQNLRALFEQFCNFCLALKIPNSFSGCKSTAFMEFNDELKNDLLSNIDLAMAVVKCQPHSQPLPSVVNNISNSQHQEQSQSVEISVITEALRKSLTGEQYDEIMELLRNKSSKKSISDKLKDFGENVAAGILSTILSSLIV